MLRPGPLTLESLDDVDRILGQLTLIGSVEADLQAEFARKEQALKDELKAQMLVEMGDETWSFQDYREKATAALELYAEAHRAEILADVSGKTRKFTHGTISYRDAKPVLVDLDGKKKTTKTKFLTVVKDFGKEGVVAAIATWLAGFVVNKKVTAAEIYRVDVDVDRVRVLALALEKKLSPAWLKSRNLKVQTGGEVISIEPAAQLVQSETTQRAAA
jgi:phage host-nuclease inhibitor protein Gam